jgi:hypothetical protein
VTLFVAVEVAQLAFLLVAQFPLLLQVVEVAAHIQLKLGAAAVQEVSLCVSLVVWDSSQLLWFELRQYSRLLAPVLTWPLAIVLFSYFSFFLRHRPAIIP